MVFDEQISQLISITESAISFGIFLISALIIIFIFLYILYSDNLKQKKSKK